MAVLSRFQQDGQAFLSAYPFGTLVLANALQTFVEDDLPTTSPLKYYLTESNPAKRIAAIVRNLNHGGSSLGLTVEDQKFRLVTIESGRSYRVVKLSDFDADKTEADIGKIIIGTSNTLASRLRALQSHDLDQLPAEERAELEARIDDAATMQTTFKPWAGGQVATMWGKQMARLGIPAEHAAKLLASVPLSTRFQKLLRATT